MANQWQLLPLRGAKPKFCTPRAYTVFHYYGTPVMASIENRSRIQVTVKHRDDLTQTFARDADQAVQRYAQAGRPDGLGVKLKG